MYKKYGKRIFDIVMSIFALVILIPVFLVISLAILIDSGTPIFFVQERLGRIKKPFQMFKFRTMKVGNKPVVRNDGTFMTSKIDARVTRIGRYLRVGFDELPQLVNILKGDMSIVGPRPDLAVALEMTNDVEKLKYLVKPGLTNLPAINGRNNLDFKERIKLDLYYIENISFILDIKIIFRTLLLILGFQQWQKKSKP